MLGRAAAGLRSLQCHRSTWAAWAFLSWGSWSWGEGLTLLTCSTSFTRGENVAHYRTTSVI
jgi:hypothetical protein